MRADQAPQLLWQYCCELYAEKSLTPHYLALQQDFDANVNMLLLCCYLAEQGQVLSVQQWADFVDQIRPWHDHMVVPLRTARQAACPKEFSSSIASPSTSLNAPLNTSQLSAAFWYAQLKCAELRAEKKEIEMLATMLCASNPNLFRQSVQRNKKPAERWVSTQGLLQQNMAHYCNAAALSGALLCCDEYRQLLDGLGRLATA